MSEAEVLKLIKEFDPKGRLCPSFDWARMSETDRITLLRNIKRNVEEARDEARDRIDELEDEIGEQEGIKDDCDLALRQLSEEIEKAGMRAGIVPVPGQLSLQDWRAGERDR